MTARKHKTPDQVVAENIKRLRDRRGWNATKLAEKLTDVLEKDYTRFTVADLEGRRDREIRWSELVALAMIFDVPLWTLTLPADDVSVEVRVPTEFGTDVVINSPDLDIGEIRGSARVALDRDDLALHLFSLETKHLKGQYLENLRADRHGHRRKTDILAIVDAIHREMREGREDTSS